MLDYAHCMKPWLATLKDESRRALRRLRGLNERAVTLSPDRPSRGRVLLSYVIDGVLARSEAEVPHGHPHFWETRAMAELFRDEGYTVDVIHWTRRGPPPRLDYAIYIDVRRNFDRYAALLPTSCLKIAHMDTAHHLVHNGNQRKRLDALKTRRGITLPPFKLVEENHAAEQADLITILGNDFTRDSFAFAGKPVHRIRLSNSFTYALPAGKDFTSSRKRFLWMGSEGFVHKGLDLVLEAFAGLPDFHLTVCGPIDREPLFQNAFREWLYHTPNIHTEGWVDVAGPRFTELARSCVGLVYPSCSEGGGGCVLTAMHAGLIPVVTREASVDLDPACGILLPGDSVAEIQHAVRQLASRDPQELAAQAHAAWYHARNHHTRQRFREDFRAFIQRIPEYQQQKAGHGTLT